MANCTTEPVTAVSLNRPATLIVWDVAEAGAVISASGLTTVTASASRGSSISSDRSGLPRAVDRDVMGDRPPFTCSRYTLYD